MARIEHKAARKKSQPEHLPFTKVNYQILAVGLIVIALGYYALSQEPWDGTMPLVVAPILLVLGYCVIIPVGILYRKKQEAEKAEPATEPPRTQ
ncbi:MAG: hypothetical protein HY562_03975 [Ignavibacteriales bacterium]|nr:hypothetical protein [Ignavibacteriales bacterium]